MLISQLAFIFRVILLASDPLGIKQRRKIFGFGFISSQILGRFVGNHGSASRAQDLDFQRSRFHVFIVTKGNGKRRIERRVTEYEAC